MISDQSNPLPHMLPTAAVFAEKAGALGLAETDTIMFTISSACLPPASRLDVEALWRA